MKRKPVKSSVRISTLILTPDQLAAIGSLAVESTYCEQFVESLIWTFCGIEGDKGKHLTHNMQMKSRLELLATLGKQAIDDEAEKVYLIDLIARMKEANNDRNTIIHGDWGADGSRIRALMTMDARAMPTAVAVKRRLNNSPITIRATEIEKAAVQISNLTGELIQFVMHSECMKRLFASP